MARLLLALSLLAQVGKVHSASLLSCAPSPSSKDPSLKAVLSDAVKSGVCKAGPDVVTFDDMLKRCTNFCEPRGIPILLGTESSGFWQDELDGFCVGDSNSDDTLVWEQGLVENCREWSTSIDHIKLANSDFVSQSRIVMFAQLEYKAKMLDKIRALRAQMSSPKTQAEIDAARVGTKMDVFMQLIKNNMEDVMASGILKNDLKEQITTLQKKASRLDKTMEDELPKLAKYVNQCDKMMLGVGPGKEYMLDVCSVTSHECIKAGDYSRHAGCCCGVVPAAGAFDIGAKTSLRRRLNASAARRLAEEEGVDTCARAFEKSQPEVDALVKKIKQTTSGQKILDEFDTQQKAKYASFYSSCGTRRLQEEEVEHVTESGDAKVDRNLQSKYLTCDPPGKPAGVGTTGTLKVAFAETTEQNLCKDVQFAPDGVTKQALKDQGLGEICEKFCNPVSVPFLIGSTNYGFDHKDMDKMCLKPDEKVFNETFIKKCHEDGNSYISILHKSAALIAALDALELSQLLFEQKARKSAAELNELLKQRAAAAVDDVTQTKKIGALKELVKTGLKDFMGSAVATSDVLKDAQDVQKAAQDLSTSLQTVMPKIDWFLEKCNKLMTGRGSQKEYLLDMCSASSKACIQEEEAQHVGCCCGYNPVAVFGTNAYDTTIEGISADIFKFGKTRTGRSRRLSDAGAISICGEAAKRWSNKVQDYKMDQTDSKRSRYPAFYARCDGPVYGSPAPITTPKGPTPSPTPISVPTGSSSTTSETEVSNGAAVVFLSISVAAVVSVGHM